MVATLPDTVGTRQGMALTGRTTVLIPQDIRAIGQPRRLTLRCPILAMLRCRQAPTVTMVQQAVAAIRAINLRPTPQWQATRQVMGIQQQVAIPVVRAIVRPEPIARIAM